MGGVRNVCGGAKPGVRDRGGERFGARPAGDFDETELGVGVGSHAAVQAGGEVAGALAEVIVGPLQPATNSLSSPAGTSNGLINVTDVLCAVRRSVQAITS